MIFQGSTLRLLRSEAQCLSLAPRRAPSRSSTTGTPIPAGRTSPVLTPPETSSPCRAAWLRRAPWPAAARRCCGRSCMTWSGSTRSAPSPAIRPCSRCVPASRPSICPAGRSPVTPTFPATPTPTRACTPPTRCRRSFAGLTTHWCVRTRSPRSRAIVPSRTGWPRSSRTARPASVAR